VTANDEALIVDLADGRTITVPLAWFPRLAHGTAAERANWRPFGAGSRHDKPAEITLPLTPPISPVAAYKDHSGLICLSLARWLPQTGWKWA
jgi:hypothetical protein